jgi:hypothetical protein
MHARWLPTVLLLLAAGCDAGPSTPVHRPAQQLAGTWRWVSSLDVKTQRLHTPATEGFEAELRFDAESDHDGTFTYRRQGRPAVRGRFGIGSEDAPGNDFIVLEPGIDFLARNAWVSAGRDSLYLDGVMELGYNSRYVRVAR